MTTNALKQAFGEAPQGFETRVIQTVRHMESRALPRFRTAAILAMVLIFLVGTALALSSLGLLDTLTDTLKQNLLPQAQELVQQQAPQPTSPFTVEEAINDGEQIYLLVRSREKAHDETEEGSFNPMLYAGDVPLYEKGYSFKEDREAFLYTLIYQGTGADFNGTLKLPSLEIPLAFPLTDMSQTRATKTPVPLEKMSGILQHLTVKQTPLATYVYIEYSPAPDATEAQLINFEDGIWFRWLDTEGNRIEEADDTGGIAQKGDLYILTSSFRAFEAPIEEITIEFYNGMTKERFDTLTLPLSKEEE